jgi:hypothetical protein
MAKEIYSVTLTKEERRELQKTVKCGTSPAKSILRANILLLLDENSDKKMSIAKIAEVLNTSTTTVMKVKKSYFEKGTQGTLKRKQRKTPPIEAKLTGEVEAKIIALSCGEPPEGYSRWTMSIAIAIAIAICNFYIAEDSAVVTVSLSLSGLTNSKLRIEAKKNNPTIK